MRNWGDKMKNKLLVILYTILICLLPLNIKTGFISYSKILLSFSFLVFMIIFLTDKKGLKNLFSNNIIKVLVLTTLSFAFIVLISVIFNSIIDEEWIWSNFFEFLRVIEYVLILINFYYLLSVDKKNINYFTNTLLFSLLITSVIGIFQFFNIFNLNEKYIRFIAPTQYVTLVNNYPFPRIVGLSGNPNVLGLFIALAIIYLWHFIITNNFRWYYIPIILLLNVINFMTLSRSSYVCMIVGEVLLVLFTMFRLKWPAIKNTLMFLAIVIFTNLLFLVALPERLTWRVLELVDIKGISSWQNRIDISKDVLDYFNDSTLSEPINTNNNIHNDGEVNEGIMDDENVTINKHKSITLDVVYKLLGNGPDKLHKKYYGIFDNEWLMLLFRYGYIGVAFYVAMIISPLICYRNVNRKNIALYLTVAIIIFIYMIPAAIYHCNMLFAFVCILMAYSLQVEHNNRGDFDA